MKRGYTLVEFLIVLSIVGILAAIVFPVFTRVRRNTQKSSCSSNMKQIGLGLLQYTQDYDGPLPPASINDVTTEEWARGRVYGWADAIYPYIKSRRLFYCPLKEVERPAYSAKPNLTDYYLNRNLAGRNASYIISPESVLLVGEGNDGRDITNARYSRVDVPQSWTTDSNSPLMRHRRDDLGTYYLFLDGHVKYLEGTAINFGFRRAAKLKK